MGTMKRKRAGNRRAAVFCLLLLCIQCLMPSSTVHAEQTVDSLDMTKKEYDAQFFVAYVYVENNPDNPYNNPERDIQLFFGGQYDLYLEIPYYNYAKDDFYKTYGVIRATGFLPRNSDTPYHLHPYASDASQDTWSYREWLFDQEIQMMDEMKIGKDYNEFYFVCGSESFVKKDAHAKYLAMYDLFHSDTQSINENKAWDARVFDIVCQTWVETMETDDTIVGFEYEGTAYSRQDLRDMGYEVAYTEEEEVPAEQEPSQETSVPSTGVGTEDVIEPDSPEEQEQISEREPIQPGKAEETVNVIPIVIVLLLAAAVIVFLLYRKHRREDSIYID